MAKRENRRDYYMMPPEKLKIQDDPKGKFYDPRIDLPLSEEFVLNIMALGVQDTILAVTTDEGDYVVSGRQRTKAACEANRRLKARGDEPIMVPVRMARDSENIPLLEISLNEHRRNDSPLERIHKAMALKDRYSDEQIANVFDITTAQLKNWLKVDLLSPAVKKAIEKGEIQITAASKLASLEPAAQKEKLDEIISSGVKPTVETVKRAAKGEKPATKKKHGAFTRDQIFALATDNNTPNHIQVLLMILIGELKPNDSDGVKGLEWWN